MSCLPKRKSLKLSLRLVVVVVKVEIGGCTFNLDLDQWGVTMGLHSSAMGQWGRWVSTMGLKEEEQESYGDSAMAAHLFPICHGRATLSLTSSAYGFACGSIFLSFLILQNFVPLFLVFFFFFREDMELFDFMGFLCVCFPRNFLGLLEIGLVIAFMGLFLGFIFCFFWI